MTEKTDLEFIAECEIERLDWLPACDDEHGNLLRLFGELQDRLKRANVEIDNIHGKIRRMKETEEMAADAKFRSLAYKNVADLAEMKALLRWLYNYLQEVPQNPNMHQQWRTWPPGTHNFWCMTLPEVPEKARIEEILKENP